MNEKKKPRRPQVSFDDVREIALSMPEVEEVTAYGMPRSRRARPGSWASRSRATT